MGGGVERADRGTTLSPVLEVVDFASSVVRRICVRGTPLACAADNPLVAAMGNGAGKMIFVFRSGEIEIWELSVASLESSLHSYLLRRGLRLPRGMDLASMVEAWDRHVDGRRREARERRKEVDRMKDRDASGGPKHGREDEKNEPHVGSNARVERARCSADCCPPSAFDLSAALHT